jgi:uncharacterized membrane protein
MNGGLKQNYEYRAYAREQLKGKWGVTVLVILITWILTQAFASSGANQFQFVNGQFIPKDTSGVNSFASIISLIISGPLNLGVTLYFLKLARTRNGLIEDIFSGFKKFGSAFLLNLLIVIFTVLWAAIGVVPGVILMLIMRSLEGVVLGSILIGIVGGISAIIASLRYSMAYYIMNDNPEMSALEAIRASKEMMKGNKGKLFMLTLSFAGWFILGFIALFIGLLWVGAYYNTAKVNFYEDLKRLNGVNAYTDSL